MKTRQRSRKKAGTMRIEKPAAIFRALAAACGGQTHRWALQDAKAQFSEVVQRALNGEPQCVSRHGKDAVLVVSYEAIMEAVKARQNLFQFFRDSPLVGAKLELDRMQGDFREVEM